MNSCQHSDIRLSSSRPIPNIKVIAKKGAARNWSAKIFKPTYKKQYDIDKRHLEWEQYKDIVNDLFRRDFYMTYRSQISFW